MSKEIRMFGKGKVSNGRISFITEDGNGFSRPVSHKEVKEVTVEPKQAESVPAKQEEIDVPDFMKDRKPTKAAMQTGQLIYVNFGKPASPKPLERFFHTLFGGAN